VNVTDTLGRPLRDLRVSVTDRCNFRCVYCMPKEVFGRDYRFLERRELLTFEEIERLARAFVAHGVEKIRITGGEPLVRRDVERLVALLAAIPVLEAPPAPSRKSSAPANYPGEVARRWRYRDGSGELGVIASVTQPFCGNCTRARLSAEGRLYTCLFGVRGHDLRALVRGDASDEELREAIGRLWSRRTDRYSEIRSENTTDLQKIEMSYIGG
jgi:molybdenum cofactor biosynthesis enzyme MoaA